MVDYYKNFDGFYKTNAEDCLESLEEKEEVFYNLLSLYENNELKWTTRQGEEILISAMSEQHLKNSVNYLEKNASKTDYVEALIMILNKELKKRNVEQRKHLVELKDPAFNYSMFFIKTDWCSITTIVEAMFRLNTEVNMLSKLVLRPRINMTCPSLKHFKDLC